MAVLAAALFPFISPSTDARYSLAWGAELARGELPDLDPGDLPTPHPLPIALSLALSPLGPVGSLDGYELLCALAFLALVYATYRFGRALGGPAAGALAGVLVALNPRIDFFALRGFVDVPFAAAVMLAAALVAERPRDNWARALGLLALAGLLRPEAWGLAALYALWIGVHDRRLALAAAAVAAAAPAIWIGMDVLLTGDALHSLQGTQRGAEALGRTTGVDDLFPSLGSGVDRLVGWPIAAAGALTAAWALWRERRRGGLEPGERPAFAVAGALVVALLVAFALLAVADLPLNDRYLVVPALALVALAATAIVRGATSPGSSKALVVAALVAVGGTLVSAPGDARAIRDRFDAGHELHRADTELEQLLDRPALRRRLNRCRRVVAWGDARAATALLLRRDPAEISIAAVPGAGEAALARRSSRPPSGARLIAGRGPWVVLARC